MKRILVFCEREWRDPRAGAAERYVHEVFTRIGAQGNYVAWMAHRPIADLWRGAARIEHIDHIQVARIGLRSFYGHMMGLFLQRLEAATGSAVRFDAIVDCVTRTPMKLDTFSNLPVIPLLFRLPKGLAPVEPMPGPIIAPDSGVVEALGSIGVPQRYVVFAPYGAEIAAPLPNGISQQVPRLVAFAPSPYEIREAVNGLRRDGVDVTVDVVNPGRISGRIRGARTVRLAAYASRVPVCNGATLAYCGAGAEKEALACLGCGVPVIGPDTPALREYVVHGKTGLLYPPGDGQRLLECLKYVLADHDFLGKLQTVARSAADRHTWERTAQVVLETISRVCESGGRSGG